MRGELRFTQTVQLCEEMIARFRLEMANEYLTNTNLEVELLYTQLRREILEHTVRLSMSCIKGLRCTNKNLKTKLSNGDLAGYAVHKLIKSVMNGE